MRAPKAGLPVAALALGLAASPGSPALAQPAAPLEISCPAQAGLRCGIGLVDGGLVLVLHSDGARWIGKRITLAADGQPYALDAYRGRERRFGGLPQAAPAPDRALAVPAVAASTPV